MMAPFSAIALLIVLAGCSVLQPKAASQPAIAPVAEQTPEALDQSTAAEKAAALAVPQAAGERELGVVVVALGSPVEQGFWIRSSLIATEAKGRVEDVDRHGLNKVDGRLPRVQGPGTKPNGPT